MVVIYMMLFLMFLSATADSACERIGNLLSTKGGRLAILKVFRIEQDRLEYCQRRFSKMRDLYSTKNHRPCSSSPTHALAGILSSSENATLITSGCAKILGLHFKSFPNLFPFVNSLSESADNIYRLWNQYPKIHPIQDEELAFNFAYCDQPKVKIEHPWEISTYSSLSHPTIWAILFVSSIFVSIVLKWGYSNKLLSNSDSYLLTYSAAIGVPAVPSRGNSFILVIWMLSCLVTTVMYAGTVTSRVIAPTEEEALSTVSDLGREDYKLVFAYKESKNFVKSAVTGFIHHKYDSDYDEDRNALRNLFTRDVTVTGSVENCISMLSSGSKFAYVAGWPYVVYKVNRANGKLRKEGRLGQYHCYLGKRLLPPSWHVYYLAFCPPNTGCNLDRVLQWLLESGIFRMWTLEHRTMKYSKRVQDRGQVISPIKIKYKFENEDAMPIRLEGRISKIFSIWLVGIFVSCLRVVYEIVFGKRNKAMDVMFYMP